jgi:hypothetical protein
LGIITLGLVHYLLSSHPQERRGKAERGISKTYFFTNFWISRIEKVIKNSTFHPLFPSISPFEAGKETKSKHKTKHPNYNLFDF